jgi:hypothetical protein
MMKAMFNPFDATDPRNAGRRASLRGRRKKGDFGGEDCFTSVSPKSKRVGKDRIPDSVFSVSSVVQTQFLRPVAPTKTKNA